MPQRWALHLDGTCDDERINSAVFLEQLVYAVAGVARMRVLNITVSFIEEDLAKLGLDHFEDEGGVSVCALLTTSHCTLHAWPHRRAFMFDLVSCKRFVQADVEKLLLRELAVKEVVHYDVVYPGCPGDRPVLRLGIGKG